MSVVTLFYGQCGNQISEDLYSKICDDIVSSKRDSDYYNQSLTKWFRVTKTNKWEPRSILIDTELKTAPKRKHKNYSFRNIVSKSNGGSANNWAFGYYEQSKVLLNEIRECTRKEAEKSDLSISFLNIFSSAGGTGAGVGSKIIECLKNDFPNRNLINAIVLPYSKGELVTQSYNTILALAKIYSSSDSVLLFENDRLHYICLNTMNMKNISFTEINNLISQHLVSIYQPLKDAQASDLLPKLCENSLKLLQSKCAPLSVLENPCNWNALLVSLTRQSRYDYQQKNYLKPKSLATGVICRGKFKPEDKDLKYFKDPNFCKSFDLYYQNRKIFKLENCLTTVSNTNNVYFPIKSILQDALNLFKYSAYVHHYKKYGLEESHFNDSFDCIQNILQNYKNL